MLSLARPASAWEFTHLASSNEWDLERPEWKRLLLQNKLFLP